MTRGYLIGYNSNYFYTAELNIFHWKRMVGVCVGEGELNGVGSCIVALSTFLLLYLLASLPEGWR